MSSTTEPHWPFRAVYILTVEDGNLRFADMVLVSSLSVRITNPGLQIAVVMDGASEAILKTAKHRVLNVVDEVITVESPPGPMNYRNRWLKTQLNAHVAGDILYLDADTLVRGSLRALAELECCAGVANHNAATVQAQLWEDDVATLRRMEWPQQFSTYVNGGFLFLKSGPDVSSFFNQWHKLWQSGFEVTRRATDQPSLNAALQRSGITFLTLPDNYNVQLAKAWDKAPSALVWHFYSESSDTAFEHLLADSRRCTIAQLNAQVARTIRAIAPWPNTDPLAKLLAIRARSTDRSRPERHWLHGNRRLAFKALLSAVARRFRRKRKTPPFSERTADEQTSSARA